MDQKQIFPPPKQFSEKASIKSLAEYQEMYREAMEAPENFWAAQAKELTWRQPWSKVLDWTNPPFDEAELQSRDHEQEAPHLQEVAQISVSDRAVDDRLDDLRDRGGRGQASQLGKGEDHDEKHVRPHVWHVAPQRQ